MGMGTDRADKCGNGKRCMRVSAGEGIMYFVRDGCGNIFVFPLRSLMPTLWDHQS